MPSWRRSSSTTAAIFTRTALPALVTMVNSTGAPAGSSSVPAASHVNPAPASISRARASDRSRRRRQSRVDPQLVAGRDVGAERRGASLVHQAHDSLPVDGGGDGAPEGRPPEPRLLARNGVQLSRGVQVEEQEAVLEPGPEVLQAVARCLLLLASAAKLSALMRLMRSVSPALKRRTSASSLGTRRNTISSR